LTCIDKRDDLEELASFHVLELDDPHYACLPVDTLQFASLGSSHINQVLRNVIGCAGVRGACGMVQAPGDWALRGNTL
jgi:hypothetical protein